MDFLETDEEETILVEPVEFEIVRTSEELVLQVRESQVLMSM